MDNDLQIEQLPVGMLQTNCYIAGCPKVGRCIVIDAGDEAGRILERVGAHGWKVELIVNTHAHFDHMLGVEELRKATGAPVAVHKSDVYWLQHAGEAFGLGQQAGVKADRELADGDELQLGEHSFEVIHTPGHSPGGICLLTTGILFSGDTLFSLGVGRTDLPGGDWNELIESVHDRLFTLPPDTVVYPGHGPSTTIGYEKANNPFV